MLHIEKLCKHYPGTVRPQIDDLTLCIDPGTTVSIQGPSGCGKSTLLAIIAGFEEPDSGSITLNDKLLTFTRDNDADRFRREELGFIYQSFNLIDCLNVWDNIAFTARLKGNYEHTFQQALMQSLGIAPLADRAISQLSGGEQQRVAIARALNHRPSLVLADEPTGNLDEITSEQVAQLLFSQCVNAGATLIMVTHAPDIAALANRHYTLHNGQALEAVPGGEQ